MREDNSSQRGTNKNTFYHFHRWQQNTLRPTIKPYIKFNITATVLILNDKITTVRNEHENRTGRGVARLRQNNNNIYKNYVHSVGNKK